jgi:iron complex transport system ATP-binding protein
VELLDLVRDLADAGGVAIGLVLHDLDQAAAVADDLVLLDEGRVRRHGPAAEVLDAALLSEIYGIRVEVDHDARTGAVRTRPVGRHAPRTVRTP